MKRSEFEQTFGQYLKDVRYEKNLRQKDVAAITGIPKTTLIWMENGSRVPTPSQIDTLGKELALNKQELEKLQDLAERARQKSSKQDHLNPTQIYPEEALAEREHGEVLLYLRSRLGMSIRDVSERSNGSLSSSAVSRIENRVVQHPSGKKLEGLRLAFDLPEETLLFNPKPSTISRRYPKPPDIPEAELATKSSGERFRHLREKNGLSLSELAKAVDTTIGKVRSWDKGKKPTKEFIERLVVALAVPLEQLLELYQANDEEIEAMDLGAFVTYQREMRSWSKSELARRCSCNRATIMYLEQGHLPSSSTIDSLVKAFDWDDNNIRLLRKKIIQKRFPSK